MIKDFVIRLAINKFPLSKKRLLRVVEPSDIAPASYGKLSKPPAGIWSIESNYAQGDVNAQLLSEWLRGCCGEKILGALREAYPQDGILRVLISAEPLLEAEMMTMPWEVLQLPASDWASTERTSVVRLLHAPENSPVLKSSVGPLKIAILWANPDQNIPDLEDHLQQMKKFFDDRPIEFSVTAPVEFADHESVREELSRFRPDIVYHIGHAYEFPPSQGTVALRIGRKNHGSPENVGDFQTLLQEIGPPRLLFLNACSTTLGWKMNPYLGVALACGRTIDAVVAMQTEVPVDAAMVFAREFFLRLASGDGLAAATRYGRNEIQRIYKPPSFTPFIPVLTQRTRLDKVPAVDLDGRALRFLLCELQSEIERINPLLSRHFDSTLRVLMRGDTTNPRITVIQGSKDSGKSTSLRQAVREQLTEERFRSGERYIYYDARFVPSGPDMNLQIWLLLRSFAMRFRPLTEALASEFNTKKFLDLQDWTGAVSFLSAWLEEEGKAGHNYHIVLDHLDSNLAAFIADLASRVIIDTGYLILIAEDPPLNPAWPLNRLHVERMSPDEIKSALAAGGFSDSQEDVDRLMYFSNGFPYFVAGYLRRPIAPRFAADDLGKIFLKNRSPVLSEREIDVLQFAALCREPVPLEIIYKAYPADAVSSLTDKDCLLILIGDEACRLPEVLREYLTGLAANRTDLFDLAFKGFLDLAQNNKDCQGESKYRIVTRWFAEAFYHALTLAKLQRNLERLDTASDIAEKLHDRYISQGDFVAARQTWESYRDAAQELGRYDDRVSDVRYADCLVRSGEYDEAELLLEQAIIGGDIDRTQLAALFLWSNLEKDRGRRGANTQRISRLREALDLTSKLKVKGMDQGWIQTQIACLKHTLGNALGYGEEAKPEEAIALLLEAQKIFEEFNDTHQFRSISEQIEIKRYNGLLTPEELEPCKKILRENLRRLVARDMQFDAVQHLYELGRLEVNPSQRADWYQQAFQRAGKVFEPDNWHAGINWRRAQVDAGLASFAQVAPFLEEYASYLVPWQGRAWSRRKRREVLLFLAEGYHTTGNSSQAFIAVSECWKVVEEIAKAGEGRDDRSERPRIASLAIRVALKQGRLDLAREVAAGQERIEGRNPKRFLEINNTELEEYANKIA